MAIFAHSVLNWHDMDETPVLPEGRDQMRVMVCLEEKKGHFVSVAKYDADGFWDTYLGKNKKRRPMKGIYAWARYPFGEELPKPPVKAPTETAVE